MVTARPFTDHEHRRIHDAIAGIEQATAADLDLVVVRASDRYSLYPLVWAAAMAIAAAAMVVLIRPSIPARIAIAFEFVVLVAATLILDLPPLRLRLVPERVKRAHARQLAHREFAAQYARGGTPRRRVLIFVSLAERYVEIIADHETYAAADRGLWDRTVNDFLSATRSGRVADGVLNAVQACGAMLRTIHPA